MLRPYYGEYLTAPTALHWCFGKCSHMCWYCFARANNPNRRADWDTLHRAINKLLSGKTAAKNLTDALLANGHAILASNTSDPFCKLSWPMSKCFFELLDDVGIKYMIQTKGGDPKTVIPFLQSIKPITIYYTVTSDQDKICGPMEPGAPKYAVRLDILEAAKEAGHHIIIGLNPFRPSWWKDVDRFFQWMVDHDIMHIWPGQLHMSNVQERSLPQATKERFAADIEAARSDTEPELAEFRAAIDRACDMGINILGFRGHPAVSMLGGFWDRHFALGYKFVPTVEDFFGHLREKSGGEPIAVNFSYFDRWATIVPGLKSSMLRGYLMNFRKKLERNTRKHTRAASLTAVNEYFWNIENIPTVFRQDSLCFAIDDKGKRVKRKGKQVLIYVPGGTRLIDWPLKDVVHGTGD